MLNVYRIKSKEPIDHYIIYITKFFRKPGRLWQWTFLGLVVQDIGTRYPAAKLVASTKADKVIPAITEIFDEYGNPDVQISDNGPPFKSERMRSFTSNRGIEQRFSAPYFPSQNPAETFMKTLGKAMKVANSRGESEAETLSKTLTNYRQTPTCNMGIPPANAFP